MTAEPLRNKQQIPYLATRVCLFAVFAGLGIVVIAILGVRSGVASRAVQGIAMVFLGAFSFFQPLVFRVPLGQLFAASKAAAIGPLKLRASLSAAGVCLLWLSLGMRFAGY